MDTKLRSQALALLKRIKEWLAALDKVDCDRKSSSGDWAVATTATLSIELGILQDSVNKTLAAKKLLDALELSSECEFRREIDKIIKAMSGIEDSLDELSDPTLDEGAQSKLQRAKRQKMIDSLTDDAAKLRWACKCAERILDRMT